MFKKIKSIIMTMAIAPAMLFAPLAIAGVTSAACNGNIATQLGAGVDAAAGGNTCTDTTTGNDTIGNIAKKVVNILSLVIGAVAVIMIIYGGFRYITSGGESNGVSSAKNTLIYAIIGLVIVVLAQIIVHFVITTAGNSTTTS